MKFIYGLNGSANAVERTCDEHKEILKNIKEN